MNHSGIKPEKVFVGDGIVRIIAQKVQRDFRGQRLNQECLVDKEMLDWHFSEEWQCRYLSLWEIEQQLFKLGYQATFYVWHERELDGIIYEYGNYTPPSWVIHGRTKGFA